MSLLNTLRSQHGGDKEEESDDDDLPPLEPVQEGLLRQTQVKMHPLLSYEMFREELQHFETKRAYHGLRACNEKSQT